MNRDKSKLATELFPQLKDFSNPNRFIEFIKVPDLRLFCEKCLEKAGVGPDDFNNLVAEFTLDLLIRKELLTTENHQTYVDALLIAAQLFNIYYNENNENEVDQLFRARREFDEIADGDFYEHGPLPEQFREMVWDTIEGHLGDCTPMSKTKPSPNTPQDLFATAVFMTKRCFNVLGQILQQTDTTYEQIEDKTE